MHRHLFYKVEKILATAVLAFLALLFASPMVMTVTNSFMSEHEIQANYGMATAGMETAGMETSDSAEGVETARYANLKLIPDMVTLNQYYDVLVNKQQFLFMFWNSVRIVLPIVLGQLAVASMAAYAFAKIRFRGKEQLFYLYIVVMLMPFQVTLVPNYLVADRLGLIGRYDSIVLPGIFSAFGVFLLRQFMAYIPDAYSEAARVEGAGHWTVFSKIILPMTKTGIAALAILVFVDNWNMVEQPLIFLQNINMQPLSTFLSTVNSSERGIAFAASTVYMTPMLLIFLYGEDYLVQGIQLSGLKA